MTKVTRNSNKRYNSKFEPGLEDSVPEAELERDYIVKKFYECNAITLNSSLIMVVYSMVEFLYPGARYNGTIATIQWLLHWVSRRCVQRFRGTKHEERAMNVFRDFNESTWAICQVLVWWQGDSLSSEKGRNAHVSMVILLGYFLGCMVQRVGAPRGHKHSTFLILVALPFASLIRPRFGIFEPRYEALVLLVACGLGELLGGILDEMQWRHFLLIEQKNREIEKKSRQLLKESRKRDMAIETLSSYNARSGFFEIR